MTVRKWDAPANLSLLDIDSKSGRPAPTYGNLCILLRVEFGASLRFDKMRETPTLDGIAIADAEVGKIREMLERKHRVAFGREATDQAITHVASERCYHPVQEYLEGLSWDNQPRINRLLAEVLGTDTRPLYQSYIRLWFIGCVARALEPGCKLDTVLVLQGDQGFRKSTFFEALTAPWFGDSHVDFSTRQGMITLNSAWVYEWGEVERILLTREDAETKSYIVSRIDRYVPPYGRAVKEHPRSTVIVGTTNAKKVFRDPTGSRRYWVIRIFKRVNVELLREWRDQLWAEAVTEYLDGRQWHLDATTDAERASDAEQYQQHDAWREPLMSWLNNWYKRPRNPTLDPSDALTTAAILSLAFKLDIGAQRREEQRRLSDLMHSLGYELRKRRVGAGKDSYLAWCWQPEADEAATDEEVSDALP